MRIKEHSIIALPTHITQSEISFVAGLSDQLFFLSDEISPSSNFSFIIDYKFQAIFKARMECLKFLYSFNHDLSFAFWYLWSRRRIEKCERVERNRLFGRELWNNEERAEAELFRTFINGNGDNKNANNFFWALFKFLVAYRKINFIFLNFPIWKSKFSIFQISGPASKILLVKELWSLSRKKFMSSQRRQQRRSVEITRWHWHSHEAEKLWWTNKMYINRLLSANLNLSCLIE